MPYSMIKYMILHKSNGFICIHLVLCAFYNLRIKTCVDNDLISEID